jgi:hypothetical protein
VSNADYIKNFKSKRKPAVMCGPIFIVQHSDIHHSGFYANATVLNGRFLMSHRRRRVFIETPKGRRSAGFTVPADADAVDVSMRLRERGWAPYRLRLEPEQHAWIAVVIDRQRVA